MAAGLLPTAVLVWASMPAFMPGIHDFICRQTARLHFYRSSPRKRGPKDPKDPRSDEGHYALLWIPACAGMSGEWDRAESKAHSSPRKRGSREECPPPAARGFPLARE